MSKTIEKRLERLRAKVRHDHVLGMQVADFLAADAWEDDGDGNAECRIGPRVLTLCPQYCTISNSDFAESSRKRIPW